MSIRALIILGLVGASSIARADANAEVTTAFTTFIEGVAANKAALTGVGVFVVPAGEETSDDDRRVAAVPRDLAVTRSMIGSTKLKVTKVMVSKGGKSAWIAGEVSGKVKRQRKEKTEPLRVSGFLVRDDKGWHVQAIHISTGEPDTTEEMCGALDDWRIQPDVPKAAEDTVQSVFTALEGEQTRAFVKLLSDNKNAVVIGSAPNEVFIGGAKIKGVFKKWKISAPVGESSQARAAIGPDSEMMWIAMSVTAPAAFCTAYRTLFVLAKERAGWRIVHHHYSQSSTP